MKIGVLTVLLSNRPFEEALDYLVAIGVEAVEIGTGAYPGSAHCKPDELLRSDAKLRAFRRAIESRNLAISALSCHGNPLHPQRARARADHRVFEQTVRLAAKLDVPTVITFSGCPGSDSRATQPSWITAPWPPEFLENLEWQWKAQVIPYWKDTARLLRTAGVRVAIEMHPNFVAYNPETMLRLRKIAPRQIGCNFDPSHLFWQQIDVVAAVRALGAPPPPPPPPPRRIDPLNTQVNGVLDAKRYTRERDRAWLFRTVGYGHDAAVWRDLISALRLNGYDDVISIEHEDSLMSPTEGLEKAVAFLKGLVISERPGEAYWA